MPNLEGKTLLNRFQVLESLGRGGMAEVYKVWDKERSVDLAMKVLHEELAIDRVFVRRFKREAQTLAKLQHPSIVRFYGFEQDDDLAFMLLDYVEGRSLKRLIYDHGGPLPLDTILTISQRVLSALGYAHRQGFVHADIKPGNILIDDKGRAHVSDFGIARMTDAATMTMAGAGTPAYMAPETIRGEAPTPAVDIYGWGVVLFEMLTGGERPFTGEQATVEGSTGTKVRWEHLNLEPPSPRKWNLDMTPALEAIVLRSLAKEPKARYASVSDLLRALGDALGKARAEAALDEVETVVELGAVPPAGAQPEPQSPKASTEHSASLLEKLLEAVRPLAVVWALVAVVGVAAILLVVIGLGNGGEDEAIEATQTALAEMVTEADATEMESPTVTNIVTFTPTITSTPEPEAGDIRVSEIDGMELIFIPAGSFMMGSEEGGEDEQPVHEVYLASYWIDRTEVTNTQFATFLNAVGNQGEVGATWLGVGNDDMRIQHVNGEWIILDGYDQHPVDEVTWFGAQAYCQRVGRRLPTEAEWEHAARGEDERTYPWGELYPSCELANYYGCEGETSTVVSHPEGVSPYGLEDMAGNVFEWVYDWYDEDYYERSPLENPNGPLSGGNRVYRGGAWNYIRYGLRSTYRDRRPPEQAIIGFRCAVSSDIPELVHEPVSSATPSISSTDESGAVQISPVDEMEMVYIPAGSFMMGSESGDQDEQPVHEVYLEAYWIDRTEVTNAMFALFLNADGNEGEGGATLMDEGDDARIHQIGGDWVPLSGYEEFPITGVTWYGAQAYCQWAGRRLPSEAEWERAAQGENGGIYPWGDDLPNCYLANYLECEGDAAIVGSHPEGASSFDAMDMAGNVWEWVVDWYRDDYYGRSSPANPIGPLSGDYRVVRGGSWGSRTYSLRVAGRHSYEPRIWSNTLGFRCAFSP